MAEALRRLGFSVDEEAAGGSASRAGRARFPRPRRSSSSGSRARPRGSSRRSAPGEARGVPDRRRAPDAEAADEGPDRRAAGARRGHPVPGRRVPSPRDPGLAACAAGRWPSTPRESSQMLSALLMVAPLAEDGRSSRPRRRGPHALRADDGAADGPVRRRRAPARAPRDRSGGRRPVPFARGYAVEPDATSASYFAALPLVAGRILTSTGSAAGESLQGDIRFLDVLAGCGANVSADADGTRSRSPPSGARGRPRLLGVLGHVPHARGDRAAPEGPDPDHGHRPHPQAGDGPGFRDGGRSSAPRPGRHRDRGLARDPPGAAAPGRDGGDPRRPPVRDELRHPRLPRPAGRRSPWLSIADPACCAKTFPGFFTCWTRSARSPSLA
jgi:hypothetical protein